MKQSILFYTIGTRIMPSSRARIFIYSDLFKRKGVHFRIIPAVNDYFCKKRISGERNSPLVKHLFSINALFRLLAFIISIFFYKTIVVQKILFPVKILPLIKRITRKKIVYFDLDDMIYRPHPSDHGGEEKTIRLNNKFKKNMALYNKIIVSTEYLKQDIIRQFHYPDDFFREIINPIDTDLFKSSRSTENGQPVIGWIGTPTNTSYLEECSHAINMLYEQGYHFTLFLVGAVKTHVKKLFNNNIDIRYGDWSLEREVSLYDEIDIGLMPLPDNPWSRTKAGYKLMLYMSMGKIGVASDIGINREIINHGKNGFLIKSPDKWLPVLKEILDNYHEMERVRTEARKTILERYSKKVSGDRLMTLLAERGLKQ